MIYLQREKKGFERTKHLFEESYSSLLQIMFDTFKEKGRTRDTGSPIHHRQSPAGLLSIAQAKCRRLESLLSEEEWETSRLPDIIEECVDASNYLLYIAALCQMLRAEPARAAPNPKQKGE